jgi:hypothetical protein
MDEKTLQEGDAEAAKEQAALIEKMNAPKDAADLTDDQRALIAERFKIRPGQ